MKKLFGMLFSSSFWENGIVMIVFSIIIGILLEFFLFKFLEQSTKRWLIFLPSLICLVNIIFSVIMLVFPNGTGGVTQHFYFGILMYSLSVLIITLIFGSILFFVVKHK